jgi:hypothetical protein
MRSRPLGCHVSTITFLTAIVAFLVGLVTVGIVVTGWKFGNWARERWRGRQPGWWRGWRLKLVDVVDARRDGNGEVRRSLLERGSEGSIQVLKCTLPYASTSVGKIA